jgi:hypothetical protein
VGESRQALVAAMWASCCCRAVGELALVAAVWASFCCRDVWVHGVDDERDFRVFAKGCEKRALM